MIQIRQVKIPISNNTKSLLEEKIIKRLNCSKDSIVDYTISKKSIDARDKNNILFVYEINVKCLEEEKILKKASSDVFLLQETSYEFPKKGNMKLKDRPIIIGSGPAGLFCTYLLAEHGYQPILFERGEKIEDRIKTVENFFQTNELNTESNIQFGEGGAGTFSDGKLNTLTKDKEGRSKKVLEVFVENGAPEEILYEQHPHIGTDILREVIINMRNKILSKGGSIHYNSCMTDLIIENNEVKGVIINGKEEILSSIVVLAIGHSARDTFYMLKDKNIEMRPKNFAVGLRIEHPKEMIDISQYGPSYKLLGSANYKLTYQTKGGRGVYSFCMCPGGFVVNASSEKEMICSNGMSNYKRDENNSNSAIVVTVTPKDYGEELFGGLEFQRKLEHLAYIEGKGKLPVQLYKDYKLNQTSLGFGEYIPNTKGDYTLSNLNNVLPEFINDSIKEALPEFGKKIKGFDREDAILIGVETRTSSPIVIVRNEIYNSSVKGLYPCGEGAGYAGGITTAAIDGMKIAEVIGKNYYYDDKL